MAIRIVQIHAADDAAKLNTEWFVVENTGDKPFSTKNCALGVAKGGARAKALGTIAPGFVVNPGDKMRVITGNPGRKAHGEPPVDEVPNYHLFLADQVLRGPGTVLTLSLRTLEVARASFDPETASGVKPG
jgi:hypothetical protein